MAQNHKRCLTAGVLLLGLTAGSMAQVGQKVYLDGNYSIVNSPEVARYYREAMHGETGHLLVRIYHTDGTLKMEGSYLATSPDVPDGFFTYYYRNGQVESQGEYVKGRKARTWKRWTWDGATKPDRIYPEPQNETVSRRLRGADAVCRIKNRVPAAGVGQTCDRHCKNFVPH